ncbi:hypothetical protein [Micromonospora sp. NPDC047074]|uniref:hypothetical protein n=1 Tax=Micromonospora sp. NPDC047074 TaxID=3154339 RepID=UPI0033F80A27
MTGTATLLHHDGTEEIPRFLGAPGAALFGCLHRPAGVARSLVVLCSSIGAEWKYNYRREVLLARRLAERGVAAVRFHYLGSGNSDDGSPDFAALVAQARQVEAWGRAESGATRVGYFGARFGALVAAAASADTDMPLTAWGAPGTGAGYFRELLRIERVGRLAEGSAAFAEAEEPRVRLARGEPADVVGYPLPPELYDSAQSLVFTELAGTAPRDVCLVEIGGDGSARRAAESLTERGLRVHASRLVEDRSWWLHDADWRPDETRQTVRNMIEETVDWFLTVLPT